MACIRSHGPPVWTWVLACLLLLALLLPVPARAQEEKAIFQRARSDYQWLVSRDKAKQVYQNWLSLADRFARIYTSDPRGPLADQALWWMARVRLGAFQQFKHAGDLHEAKDLYVRLTLHFPRSNLADDAQFRLGQMEEEAGDLKAAYLAYLRVTVNHPRGDMVPRAKARLDALEKKLAPTQHLPRHQASTKSPNGVDPTLAAVTGVRHWSNPNYTRVVLSLERPVPYHTRLLKKAPGAGRPRRLYLDLRGAWVTTSVQPATQVKDGLLKRVRVAQFNQDTVRLVLDIERLASYKVFTLDNPFRLVVDCFGQSQNAQVKQERNVNRRKRERGKAQEKPPSVGLAAALGLRVKKVVLDPGHGGKDPGATWQGLVEKNLVLDIARRAAPKLAKLLNCKVLLTRDRDKFVPLEDRTAFANTNDADIFVSIHLNAAPSHRLSGIETYFLNLASDEESLRVAARENATTQRSISDLQVILNDLMLNSKINESNRLARALQKSLLGAASRQHKVRDLKVKQAPFYVLIGAGMPAVLTEMGFITNPTEHRLLASAQYREQLAQGLAQGVAAYAKSLKMAQP